MKRRALILSNPGEIGAQNYCEGVKVDVSNYTSFLKSALGGAWYDHEITRIDRPTKDQAVNAISELSVFDYSFIVFCGHGYYSSRHDSTILELQKNEEIDSLDLRVDARMRTILLDCCRKIEKDIVTEDALTAIFKEARTELNPAECRKYFEKKLEECSAGIVVGYACSKDETAGDSDSKGGYYSYSVLKAIANWREKKDIDLSKKWSALSIVEAHNRSVSIVSRLSGGTQNPDINKPRSVPYFPIAIMA